MKINETAAQWWADRFVIEDKREALKAALLKHLPDGDWETYNDYDPSGPLLAAVREVTECRGCMFSGDGLFPRKTGLNRRDDVLRSKEGYGADWVIVPNVPVRRGPPSPLVAGSVSCPCGWAGKRGDLRRTGSATHADDWWECPTCGRDGSQLTFSQNKALTDSGR